MLTQAVAEDVCGGVTSSASVKILKSFMSQTQSPGGNDRFRDRRFLIFDNGWLQSLS